MNAPITSFRVVAQYLIADPVVADRLEQSARRIGDVEREQLPEGITLLQVNAGTFISTSRNLIELKGDARYFLSRTFGYGHEVRILNIASTDGTLVYEVQPRPWDRDEVEDGRCTPTVPPGRT